ncbi:helix-turn-helix domain-containing protein [Streptomyces sp. NPDC014656]|uniref:helix-turn-helix domain-containing protein n=1 Tax=Streptomyces sp. NPDC014656 TaxID=3364878 RepID=UPI0036F6DDEA
MSLATPDLLHRGRVKVPMRLVESAHYSDAAVTVYIKIKALGARKEACTAGLATLASYLGLSVSTVQRGLAELRSPAPDGVVELPDSRRRTLRGGTGTTARRKVREMWPNERFIWLPVVASERLRPRLLRAYAVISFAVVQNIPLTERELAGYLRHHSGHRAGQPITTEAAGRIIDELAESHWVVVDRRAGAQGRHLFSVLVERTTPSSAPDDRSGPDLHDRSLAYEEDLKTDRLENEPTPWSPAVGEPQVEEPAHELAETARPVAASRDHALRADGETPRPSPARDSDSNSNSNSNSNSKPPYRGPQLTFSPRLHTVLEPVRFLLTRVNTYVQRRIGQEISRQLDHGTEVPRLRARLTHRLARTLIADIRDPGRWLLGVGLPRWGCADPDCEAGVLWSTGVECRVCREVIAERAARRRSAPLTASPTAPPTAPPAPTRPAVGARLRIVECCPECERPHHRGNSGLCAECRPRPGLTPASGPPTTIGIGCRGREGTCGRPAPRGLCWRCRAEEGAPVPMRTDKRLPAGTP